MLSQNMLLWHDDYLDLVALEIEQMQEAPSDFLFSSSQQEIKLPRERCLPCTGMKKHSYLQRWELKIERSMQTDPVNIAHTFY